MATGSMYGDGWTDLGGDMAVRAAGCEVKQVAASTPTAPAKAAGRRGIRGGKGEPDTLDGALRKTGMRTVKAFELTPPPLGARRRGGKWATEAELTVPPPPEGHGQVVLVVDELGVATWHLPEAVAEDRPKGPAMTRRAGRSGAAMRRYRLPLAAASGGRGKRRGFLSGIVKKLVKVLIFPLAELVLGPLAKFLALKWEEQHAPYVARTFTAANFATEVNEPLDAAEWQALSAGPALLFLHGTFSTAHGGFVRLTSPDLEALHAAYQGRVFAFNHHTVGHDPKRNVEEFCKALPAGVTLELDIVCHSRGGLFARTLAFAADDFGGNGRVKVRRIVFLASPNDGTALADAKNMVQLLDRFTAVTRFLPDGPIEVVAEAVVTAVQVLAGIGLKCLPGLAAQAPDSPFLQWLRTKPTGETKLYAVAADFEPTAEKWTRLVGEVVEDQVMDRVFKDEPNDLVVPTLGVGETTQGPGFPVPAARLLRLSSKDGVTHTSVVGHRPVVEQVLAWLGEAPDTGARRGRSVTRRPPQRLASRRIVMTGARRPTGSRHDSRR